MAASMIEGNAFLRRNQRDEDGTSYHGVIIYRVSAVLGDQAAAIDAVRLALYNALSGDATFVAALRQPTGGSDPRVFHGEAPTGQALNYLVIADGSEAENLDESAYDPANVAVDDEIVMDLWWIPRAPTGTMYPNRHYGVDIGYKHVARILNTKRLVLT